MTIESDIEDIKEDMEGVKRALRFFIDKEIDKREEERRNESPSETRAHCRFMAERDFGDILDGLRERRS